MTVQLAEQKPASKADLYVQLAEQLRSLLAGERDLVANAANVAALLYCSLPDLNWAKGVCGTAAERRATVLVDNVHEFPGHIACDSGSNSEIVVPAIKGDRLIGVLDLDSPSFGRFDEEDARGLDELVRVFVKSTECGFAA